MSQKLRAVLSGLFLLLGAADLAVLSLVLGPRLAREREAASRGIAAEEGDREDERRSGGPEGPVRAASAPAPAVVPLPSVPEAPPEAGFVSADKREPVEILFQRDSIQIGALASMTLERVAAQLKHDPQRQVVVRGHSCNLGTPEYNRDISRRRALAVEAFLARRGVPASRIAVEAVGSSEPVDRGANAAALARNRRVQILSSE